MEKIAVVVMIKENEKGLLSIAENRAKSMIPLLGDARLLDFYLYHVRLSQIFKVFINIKTNSIQIKDYINYHYRDFPVKIIIGDNIFDNILKVIKRERHPVLIVQADGFLYCNWNLFNEELLNLRKDNYVIFSGKEGNTFKALYINDRESFYDLLRGELESNSEVNTNYDDVWEILLSLSDKNCKRIEIESIEDFKSLRTVREYYDFHINLLNNMELCFKYTSLFHDESLKDKEDITVTSRGEVRNSYISSSSYIEGMVEESFIFSNVKVLKGGYIYRSIIMNNNSIAENARLEKIILCDGGELLQTVLPRIGEDAVLGGRSENGYNKVFPEYINRGISLIGSNVDIPRGFVMAENCYISSNTGRLILKEKKKLLDGESLIGESNKV